MTHTCDGRWSLIVGVEGRYYQFWSEDNRIFALWSGLGFSPLTCTRCRNEYLHINLGDDMEIHEQKMELTWDVLVANPESCVMRAML